MLIDIGRKMGQNCQKKPNRFIMTKKLQELLHVITILKKTNYFLFKIVNLKKIGKER